MKKHYSLVSLMSFSVLLTLLFIPVGKAQTSDYNQGAYYCRIGLEYQRFTSTTNATNRPIILSVEPFSPADAAGLKPGDFIETINGKSSSHLTDAEVNAMLLSTSGEVELEVSNFGYKKARRTLTPLCIDRNFLDESVIVDSFAFYSLEDASTRTITYPFVTVGDSETVYEDLHNFGFSPSVLSHAHSEDSSIVDAITESLEQKGLTLNPNQADIVIDFYYTIAHAPSTNEGSEKPAVKTLRYDFQNRALRSYPLLGKGANVKEAPYILTFGINVFNDSIPGEIIWSCEAVEFLSEELSIGEYARMAVPAMLLQFPAIRYNSDMQMRIVNKSHYYTGVVYDANDLSRVAQVAKGSPAEKAGILPGDLIIAINGKPMASSDELTQAYRRFLKETLFLRDESTLFTNREGVHNCRYWHVKNYEKIAKEINRKKYKTVFSYLFAFRPYIIGAPDGSENIYFDVNRKGVPMTIVVTPSQLDCGYIALD